MAAGDSKEEIKETVEFKTNPLTGQKIKVTRKTVLRQVAVSHGAAVRKNWAKFGECKGFKAGPDSNSTSIGDDVFLKLSSNPKDLDAGAAETEQEQDAVKKAMSATKIVCRICKGDHWTNKCPYKDTYQPINEIKVAGEAGGAGGAGPGGADAPGKYVPAHRRAGAAGGGSSMPGMGNAPPDPNARNDDYTIRITNLSTDVTDNDVRDLVINFGGVQRISLPKHWDSGLLKGFAFVQYYNKSDAQAAIDKLNGFGYDNLILHVSWSSQT